MWRKIGLQAIRFALVLVIISILCFILTALSPIDPLVQYLGGEASVVTEEQAAKIATEWGFDKPYSERYFIWISRVLHGDWGKSSVYNLPVLSVIGQRFKTSLVLMITAWIISGILGFSFGVIAAQYEGKLPDKILKTFSLTMAASPTFWVGLIVILIFSVKLNWFPAGLSSPIGVASSAVTIGQRIHHLVLPALTLSLGNIASIILHTRQKMLDVYHTDYVLFAKARGEKGWKLLFHHGLKNILLPAITIQFGSLSEIFGGSALCETVFSYPGLGNAVVNAGIKGDIPLLLGVSIFSAIFVFVGNIIANLLYPLVDPRIREEA